MKKLFISFVLFFMLSNLSFGQGAFFEPGTSGTEINAGFSKNDAVFTIGGGFGYSIKGRFDLGVKVGRSTSNEKLLENNSLVAISIYPTITFHVLKQSKSTPASLSLTAYYYKREYSVENSYSLEIESNGFGISSSIYKYAQISSSMRIQPSIGISYIVDKTEIGNDEVLNDNTILMSFGISLVFDVNSPNLLVATPRISFWKEYTSFGLNISFIMPKI